jgi:hypothetical protein
MAAPQELPDRIKRSVEDLPYDKQQEVYDFAEYLKTKWRSKAPKDASLADLIGIMEGPSDLSANHDEIYD